MRFRVRFSASLPFKSITNPYKYWVCFIFTRLFATKIFVQTKIQNCPKLSKIFYVTNTLLTKEKLRKQEKTPKPLRFRGSYGTSRQSGYLSKILKGSWLSKKSITKNLETSSLPCAAETGEPS